MSFLYQVDCFIYLHEVGITAKHAEISFVNAMSRLRQGILFDLKSCAWRLYNRH